MRKRIPYELYDASISVKENAEKLGCSEAAIRKHIRSSSIDRRHDNAFQIWRGINSFTKAHPGQSLHGTSKALGHSVNTIKKYIHLSEEEIQAGLDNGKISTFNIKNSNCIKSISFSQDELLLWIMRLYNSSQPFECDLTYSKGLFYKRVPQPLHRYDIYPQVYDVRPLSEADSLPDGSFSSIIYDLPFVVSDEKSASIIKDRFTFLRTNRNLFKPMMRCWNALSG